MWPFPSSYFNPINRLQSAYNKAVSTVSKTYDKAVATTKSAYNQTSSAVSKAGLAAQKWTVENKTELLSAAKNMQDVGDKTALTGTVMAVAGAPIAGVGAAPGVAVASTGKAISLAGSILEVGVEIIAGNGTNAAITSGNEGAYMVVGAVGERALNKLMPGASQIKDAGKQVMGIVEGMLKKETDKTVDKLKQ